MSEIPADVWEDAKMRCPSDMFTPGMDIGVAHNATIQAIARAIMAERERCVKEMAYHLTKAKVTTIDPVKSIKFRGLLVIAHPEMPPHVWDGEKMSQLEIALDPGAPS